MSLPPEILKKVKLLEISTRRVVNNLFAGEYHSAFKGQGMTFSEFREYVPGDDVRSIAWALTARTGKPYIKKFDEEREMTLMLAVDVSGSGLFGSHGYLKAEAMTHLAALLSFSAVVNKDPVGLLLFSDQAEHYVPPKKGRGQVHRILRDLYYFKPKSKKTSIDAGLRYLQGVLKKKSNLFIFSDFMDSGYERSLSLIGKKHEAVAVVITDPLELELPDLGLIELHDAETDETFVVDSSSKRVRDDYKKLMLERKQKRDQELLRSQIDRIDITTHTDIVQPLVRFFQRRHKG